MPWLGAALGGVGAALGGASSKNSGRQTTTTELPSYLQPYGPEYAQRVQDTANLPYPDYQYNRIAPFSEDTLAGMDMARNAANYSQPLFDQAQGELSKTMSGAYLSPDSNPWLKATYDAGAGRMADAYKTGTAAQTNASAGFGGAFGGSAHSELQGLQDRSFGDSLGQWAKTLYGNNYQAERNNQLGAVQAAPGFSGLRQAFDFGNANALNSIGQQQQGLGQSNINADYAQFQDANAYPYKQLDTFASMFNPNLGRTATQSQSINPMLGALGGAAGGLGMARSFGLLGGGNPFSSQPGSALSNEVSKLGSSTWNPFSDYNTGRNGWGRYGE
jgi:hypothetical protein